MVLLSFFGKFRVNLAKECVKLNYQGIFGNNE